MTYAQGRQLFDADSHVMELPGFLTAFAGEADRHLIADLGLGSLATMFAALSRGADGYPHQPTHRVAELEAMGDQLLHGPKFYEALGAFNPDERRTALDLLGFEHQVVFPTLSASTAFFAPDPDACYATARAADAGHGGLLPARPAPAARGRAAPARPGTGPRRGGVRHRRRRRRAVGAALPRR